MTARPIIIHMMFDDTEKDEIACHDYDANDEGHPGHESCKEGTNESRTESEEERKERKTAADRVEDHDTGQAPGCIFRCSAEVGFLDIAHDLCGIVPDVFAGAVVLIRGSRRNIKNTMAESTECHR